MPRNGCTAIKSERIALRINPILLKKLKSLAKKEGMTVSNTIHIILEKHMEALR